MPQPTDNPPNYPINNTLEISVVETQRLHQIKAKNFLLLDIRESHELQIAHIPGALHIPMGDLPGAMSELDVEEDTLIAVLCRTGKRSLDVTLFLQEQGFHKARSIAGGIHWWSDRLDSSLIKY